METLVYDRTGRLPAELRVYASRKVSSLADHFDAIAAAQVEFDRDLKKRHEPTYVVKISLRLLGHRLPGLRVKETGRDQRATFDVAMDRIDGELTALKERVRSHP